VQQCYGRVNVVNVGRRANDGVNKVGLRIHTDICSNSEVSVAALL
jgi:hypothetical protein